MSVITVVIVVAVAMTTIATLTAESKITKEESRTCHDQLTNQQNKAVPNNLPMNK